MKKLLMLLFPLLVSGLGSCTEKKADYDVTIICKNAESLSDEPLKTSTIRLQEGTYVDGDYLVKKGLIPEIEEYDYVEFQGPAAKVDKSTSYVLLYSKVKYKLTIKYRNFEVPDTSIPGVENKIIEVPIGTVVDETYLREEGCIIPISGLTFKSIDPIEQTLLDKSEVRIFYRTQTLDVTVKYRLKGDAITEIAPDKVFDNARYGSLVSQAEAVKTIANYTFDSTNPALPYTVIEARDITVWYTRKTINVTLRFRDAEADRDINNYMPESIIIPSGTNVDASYLSSLSLIKSIPGYELKSENYITLQYPNPQTTSGAIIDILYVRKTGNVKIEYWLGDPDGEPVKQGAAQTVTNYRVGDVIVGYEQLKAYGLINIPVGHEVIKALVNGAEIENKTVSENELVIKVYYKAKDIPVKIVYWKGKKDAVGSTTGPVDNTATIPYGTSVVGAAGYQTLLNMGVVKTDLIPQNYIFNEIDTIQKVTEATSGKTINIYFTNTMPVTIIYHKGAPGNTTVYKRDENVEMAYNLEISSYDDIKEYIDSTKVPEGCVFHSMDPSTVTIDREGIVIRIYYTVPPTL